MQWTVTGESGLTAKVPDEQREGLRHPLEHWPAVITYDTCGCGDFLNSNGLSLCRTGSQRTQRSST